ncbi:MAG: family 10 glycosylhydrolase [Bacteroidales bacterium]
MSRVSCLLIIALIILFNVGQYVYAENPKYEIRAVWLTTNYGLDWPKRPATTPLAAERQKQDLCRLLDIAKEINLNTVFFQARLRSDVLYNSKYEPYNSVMTGTRSKTPLYDPLAFVVEECHKRGLQCHAWLVCMNVGKVDVVKKQGNASLPSKYPDMCIQYKGEWYLNPGEPQTCNYLVDIVKEVIENYNVDGIHLDYIRYPDRAADFPDRAFYNRYSSGGESLATWRINNINRIVYGIYDAVKQYDPHIQVSSAVLGKRNRLPKFSSFGWSGIEAAYQDAAAWLKNGRHDFVAPMLYYSDRSFYPFLKDWIANSNGCPIVAGLGAYRLLGSEGNWSLSDFMPQIYIGRNFGASGTAFYRMQQLSENTKCLSMILQSETYNTPALFPPMKNSLGKTLPPPYNLRVSCRGNMQTILWEEVKGAKYYTIYASETFPVNTKSAANIIEPRFCGNSYKTGFRPLYYAVTATDGFYRETSAVQQQLPLLHFNEGEHIKLPSDKLSPCDSVIIYNSFNIPVYDGDCINDIITPLKSGVYSLRLIYKDKVVIYPLVIK